MAKNNFLNWENVLKLSKMHTNFFLCDFTSFFDWSFLKFYGPLWIAIITNIGLSENASPFFHPDCTAH